MRVRPGDRLVVRLPSWLGDVVMAEPLVRALHARWSEAGRASDLALAGPGRLLELVAPRAPGAELVATDGDAKDPRAPYRDRDVALLLDGSWRSAARALAARVPVRVGWTRGGRGVLLTHGVTPARERGGVPAGLGRAGRFPRWLPRPFGAACAELGGLLGVAVRDTRPELRPSAAGRARAEERLVRAGLAGRPFVLVQAGARPGTAKAPPPELWGRVLAGLAARGVALAVACAPGEEEAARAAVRAAGDAARARLWDDPPPGLDELLALSAAAALVVTPDSGPRHLAVAVGTPVVCLFGPTDPRHTADHLARTRCMRRTVPCGPCHLERCPLPPPETGTCLADLDPDEIVAAAGASLR